MLSLFSRSRWTRRLLTFLALLSAAWSAAAYWVAGKLLEPAHQNVGQPPEDFPAEEIAFESQSGAALKGWYQRGAPGHGVVVILHGIRSNRWSSLPRAKLFADAGFSTLVFDLRCHGQSTGDQITLGHAEALDAKAAVAFARSQNPGVPVAVVGFSLGGAAAALASPLDVDAIVLEAVYPTIDAAVNNRTRKRLGPLGPLATWSLLVQLEPRTGVSRDDLRPIDSIRNLGCPVLIVGGRQDHQTTPADTLRLFDAAVEPKELLWFENLGHNNFAYWQPDRYREQVVGFVERSLAIKPSSNK